jgi:hypothetical protein
MGKTQTLFLKPTFVLNAFGDFLPILGKLNTLDALFLQCGIY